MSKDEKPDLWDPLPMGATCCTHIPKASTICYEETARISHDKDINYAQDRIDQSIDRLHFLQDLIDNQIQKIKLQRESREILIKKRNKYWIGAVNDLKAEIKEIKDENPRHTKI